MNVNSKVPDGFYDELRKKLGLLKKSESSQTDSSLVALEKGVASLKEDNPTFSSAYASLSVSKKSIVETVNDEIDETAKESSKETAKLLEAKGLLDLKDFKGCEDVLVGILKDGPENFDSAIMLSDCFYLQGEPSKSIVACAAVLKANPNNEKAKLRTDRAQSVLESLHNFLKLYDQRKYKKAIYEMDKAMEIDCKNNIVTSAILINRAMALKQIRYFKAALGDFNESSKLNPDNETVYEKRAICFYELRKFAECIKDCTEATKVRPSRYIDKLLQKSLKKLKAQNAAQKLSSQSIEEV